jgi:hypothetical protein
MGGRYRPAPGEGLSPIVDKFKDAQRRMDRLETPSGTQLSSLVAQVKAAIVGINTQVASAIAAQSYTKAQIDSRIANPPAGSAVTGTISATGLATFNAGINSTDVRSRVVSSSIAAVWIDGTGRIGISSSSVNGKRDIAPVDLAEEVDALLKLALVEFRRDHDVEELGDDAPVEVGTIAEYAEALGLNRFIYRDDQGAVQGVNYERLTIPLIATVQHLNERITALETKEAQS